MQSMRAGEVWFFQRCGYLYGCNGFSKDLRKQAIGMEGRWILIPGRISQGIVFMQRRTLEERRTALVFTTSAGHYISPTSICYHFKKLAVDIGVPECRVHDLRHTFAVLSLQNGDDIKTVQDALGHATAAFTLDVYGHISERMKDDSASRMQAYIKKIE